MHEYSIRHFPISSSLVFTFLLQLTTYNNVYKPNLELARLYDEMCKEECQRNFEEKKNEKMQI